MKPFRWDIQKREQLGRLTKGERSSAYPGFIDELRKCASRLISFTDDAMVAFVGRSPESFFDYLSGIFEETSKAYDLVLLNISNRFESILEIKEKRHFLYQSLKRHFEECSVSPRDILTRKRKTLFADVVASAPRVRIVVTSNGTDHRWGKRKEPAGRLEFAPSVAVENFLRN